MLEVRAIISEKSDKIPQGSITLSFDQRHKRRCLMKTDKGDEFLLNLDRPVILKEGDLLQLNDGRLVAVKAADEDVLDLQTENKDLLIQLAWILGNMHFPIEICSNCLRIRYDHVLENDLKSFDITLARRKAPFVPLISRQKHIHE